MTTPPPQPCSICRGPTEWDPAQGAFFCPACSTDTCRVYTAPSDGREAERRREFVRFAVRVAYDMRRREAAAARVAGAGAGR